MAWLCCCLGAGLACCKLAGLPAADLSHVAQAVDRRPETQTLVSAVMGAWPESSFQPEMEVRESLGQAGEIEVETKVTHSTTDACH